MADTVQYHLERMLPELDDLEKRGLFSRSEIKEIVKRRRDFEYLLKRHSTLKQDYLRYVEYETQLEALRMLRKKALHREIKATGERWRSSLCDRSSAMHIMLIYERAVTRFKGDLDLWLRYMEYCRSSKGSRRMQKVVTKALRLHSAVPGLWIYAAAWEFEHNLNVTAARALMQRGLRMCPRSETLWLEYFRLELTYAQKLRARRLILGLGPTTRPQANGEPIKLLCNADPTERLFGNGVDHPGEVYQGSAEGVSADVEKDAEAAVADQESERISSVQHEASYKIARAIYRSAVVAIPDNPIFRQRFLEMIETIDLEQAGALEADICGSLTTDFPAHESSWDWRARHALGKAEKQGVGVTKGRIEAVKVYEDALRSVPSALMHELYAHFLSSLLGSDSVQSDSKPAPTTMEQDCDENGVAEALLGLYKRAEAAGVESEILAQGHLVLLMHWGKVEEARALARQFCIEGNTLDRSAKIWTLFLSLESRCSLALEARDGDGLAKLFRQALKLPIAEAKPLWHMAFEVLWGQEGHFDLLLQMLETAVAGGGGHRAGAEVVSSLVDWVLHSQGLERARQTYKRLLALPGPSVELFRQCIAIEARIVAIGNTEAFQHMRKLFNSAVEVYGQTDEELWLEYCGQERKAGHSEAATAVYWRAKKTLRDPSSFIERYELL